MTRRPAGFHLPAAMPVAANPGTARTRQPGGPASFCRRRLVWVSLLAPILLLQTPLVAENPTIGTEIEIKQVSPRSDEIGPDGKTIAQRVLNGSEIIPSFRAHLRTTQDADGNPYQEPFFVLEGLDKPGELEALIVALKYPLDNLLVLEQQRPIRPISER